MIDILDEWQDKYYSVDIDINDNKTYHQSVKDKLEELQSTSSEPLEISAFVYDKMVALDQYVCVRVYPSNSVGFYEVWHYSIKQAIDEMEEILNDN